MKTKFLLSRDAQLACGSAISALLVVRATLDRREFACAVKRVADVVALHKSAAERFSSICWSAAG